MRSAEYWIEKLKLQKHPEGGWFKEVYKSDEKVLKDHLHKRFAGDRHHSTSIYFLLSGNEFSAFHRIKSDELWHFYEGSATTIHMIDENGKYSKAVVGNKPDTDEAFQVVVGHGVWFASELNDKNSYALVGCTVAPGFDYADFEMGERNTLIKMFPLHKELITMLTI
jgi:predicted cupin superfamily sugar epimerase